MNNLQLQILFLVTTREITSQLILNRNATRPYIAEAIANLTKIPLLLPPLIESEKTSERSANPNCWQMC